MAHDGTTSRAIVRQNQDSTDADWLPAEALASDLRRQPELHVEWAQCALDRANLGLHLHDDQHTFRGMPAEEVDRSAVTVLGERNLDVRNPAVTAKDLDDEAYQSCVELVEQAVRGGTVIPTTNVEPRPKRGEAVVDVAETQLGQLARLELDDLPSPDAAPLCERLLGQPRTMSEQPMQPADLVPIHAPE